MALRKIRRHGDEILTKKGKPVKLFDKHLHTLLDDMLDTLRAYDGLGLAAPQVGLLRRIVVIELDDTVYELINPVIVASSGSEIKTEACLSIPGLQGDVERPANITVEALDRHGKPFTMEADSILATAVCHEIDHLEGILFIDRAVSIFDRLPEDEEDEAV